MNLFKIDQGFFGIVLRELVVVFTQKNKQDIYVDISFFFRRDILQSLRNIFSEIDFGPRLVKKIVIQRRNVEFTFFFLSIQFVNCDNLTMN